LIAHLNKCAKSVPLQKLGQEKMNDEAPHGQGYQQGFQSAAFDKYLAALRGRVGEAKYKSWFLDLGLAEISEECVTLSTGSQAKRDMLDHRFLPVLADTWRK